MGDLLLGPFLRVQDFRLVTCPGQLTSEFLRSMSLVSDILPAVEVPWCIELGRLVNRTGTIWEHNTFSKT